MPTSRIGPRALKRLTRPETPLPYKHEADDTEMLVVLARFRFADSAQIARWLGRSVRVVNRRLYRMWSHGLVSRPYEQATLVETFFHHGDTPRIWALTRTGVELLLGQGYSLARRIDWNFRPVSAVNLPHTLETGEFMIGLHREIALREGLILRDHHELVDQFPEATRTSRRPFSISAEVPFTFKVKTGDAVKTNTQTRHMTNVPDRIFEIEFADNTRINFTYERDRGGQTHDPKRLERLVTTSNTRRKQLVYFHAYRQGQFTERFGWLRQRCLFETSSERRLANLIKNQLKTVGGRTAEFPHGQAASMFLYTTHERLAKHGILGPAWVTAESDGVSILPTAKPARS
jgi:hypothetical protein